MYTSVPMTGCEVGRTYNNNNNKNNNNQLF